MNSSKEELVIVFKKGVSEERSAELMRKWAVNFREGMDSSRGKVYFYETAKKYIVTFKDSEEKMDFRMKRYNFYPEVHEIYEPNWEIQKD